MENLVVRSRVRAALAALLTFVLLVEIAPAQPALAAVSGLAARVHHEKISVAVAVPPARIPVKEPVRVKHAFPRPPSRPPVVPATRPSNPMRVSGPPMLKPRDIDAVLRGPRHRLTSDLEDAPSPATGAQRRVGPGVSTARPGVRHTQSLPSNPSASGTGINRWWRYQEENVPGGGHLMVNVGTGNMLIQDDDMSVPHKGIAMAFRRTYNSQSAHDVNADDAGAFLWKPPGMYGNGWTNTFDASIARTPTGAPLVYSVFDIDGARYDYAYVNGVLVPSNGDHSTLVSDGQCGFLWTKKSGTTYYFYRPSTTGPCPTMPAYNGLAAGYAGRLYQIIGRNRNTSITFSYSWDNGDASATGKVSAITATTESGMTTTLNFADFSGHRLLQTLTMPDGATTVQYGYDALGNLATISRPPNNSAGTRPVQSFGYSGTQPSNSMLVYAASPRWNASGGGEGGYLTMAYNGSGPASTLSIIGHTGVMNWTTSDGTNTTLQPGVATGATQYYDEFFTAGTTTPTFRDTDGHMTNWIVDGSGRPTQTQECTASTNQGQQCTGTWLITNEAWDTDDNLVSETDSRGYESDFAYDAMANAIAVAEPQTTTSQGTFRPTRLYDYDANNNVVAYCDEGETHAAGGDWTSPPTVSDSRCNALASAAGVPHFTAAYTIQSYEPNGELASMTTPLGYTHHFAYLGSQQGGTDYGLPTGVTGDSFSQIDGTTIAPTQTFWYDANGLPRCYSNGQGTTVISVDALGRTTMVADGDDSSANAGSMCGKSGGQAGWNTQTTYAYNADGSVQSSQGPAQRAVGVSTTFVYDLDGNETGETHHFSCTAGNSCTAGTTNKWYDGADRLVEVGLPQDATDYYSSPWLTRYLYDFSQSGTVSIGGTSYSAAGNLYKTQEWVPSPSTGSPTWLDQRGSAFDALDREVTKYTFSPSSPTTVRATTKHYDTTSATFGLLASVTDPLSETTAYTYNELAKPLTVQFSGDGGVTPNKSFVYDANGRVVSATGDGYGTETDRYDADGRLVEADEPTSGSVTAPAKLTYDYYPNGQRKDLNVASSALNGAPSTFSYAYRVDGKRTRLRQTTGFGDFTMSYTDGGREISQSDPFTGSTMPNPQSPVPAGSTYGPTTWTYDSGGQLSTIALPQTFAYQSIGHDAEGAVVGWAGSNSTWGPASMVFRNTVRGENVGENLASGTPAAYSSKIANGAVVPLVNQLVTKGSPPQTPYSVTVDPVNAVVTSTSQDQYVSNGDPESPMWEDCGSQTKTQNYDAASRLISKITTMNVNSSIADCANAGPDTGRDLQYTYDAENHHTATGGLLGSAGDPVSWTPDGHAYKIASNYLHYDGDQLLFVTDATGALVVAKTELLANYSPSLGQRIIDRGISGQLASMHNGSFYGGISLGATMYRTPSSTSTLAYIFYGSTNDTTCWQGSSQKAAGCAPAGTFDYARPEGFNYGNLTFQGARAIDNASGQWTTPDAYAGNVHEPMSQKAFMWDRNNPYSYSDPSGFTPQRMATCECAGARWVADPTVPQTALIYSETDGPRSGTFAPSMITGIEGYRLREAVAVEEQLNAQGAGFKTVEEYKKYLDALKQAEAKYPSKVGKFEDHHVVPKYLGGAANGPTARIPAPYHQLITNEFRSLVPYSPSSARLPPGELGRIMETIYGKYPLPGQ